MGVWGATADDKKILRAVRGACVGSPRTLKGHGEGSDSLRRSLPSPTKQRGRGLEAYSKTRCTGSFAFGAPLAGAGVAQLPGMGPGSTPNAHREISVPRGTDPGNLRVMRRRKHYSAH